MEKYRYSDEELKLLENSPIPFAIYQRVDGKVVTVVMSEGFLELSGYEGMDKMYDEYGRYMESRGRYGASHEETDRSFHYMVKALEDFIKVLYEEAETPQQNQQLREALQRSVM